HDGGRLWFCAHVESIALAAVDPTRGDNIVATLPAKSVRMVGFAEEEALIPYPKTVYPGFRLLQEFFTLPQKYAFFDVTGLEALPADKVTDRFAIIFQFKDSMPPAVRVSKDNFRLFCTPVVNLFEHPTDPIKPETTKFEYLARPSGGNPQAYEMYSVDKVIGIARRTSQRVE